MTISLSDTLSHYRAVTDTSHRYWGYFQAIAASTAAFAWGASSMKHWFEYAMLTLGFAIFAVLNMRLILGAQEDALKIAEGLKSFVQRADSGVPLDFQPIFQRLDPDSKYKVGSWHALISAATIAVVWVRYVHPS